MHMSFTDPQIWLILDRLRGYDEPDVPVISDTNLPSSISDRVERVVALANAESGGVWFIGVYGSLNWRSCDTDLPDNAPELIRAVAERIRPRAPQIHISHRDGVLAVAVESVTTDSGFCYDGNYSEKRGTFLHSGTSSTRATTKRYTELLDRVGRSDFELEAPLYSTTRLSKLPLRRAKLEFADERHLQQLGVLNTYGRETVAGLVVFGGQEVFEKCPGLGIRIAEYDIGAAEASVRDLAPSQSWNAHGGIQSAISILTSNLVRWLPIETQRKNAERLFRELLVNAVGHRTLSAATLGDSAQALSVSSYPDRIVISSPGRAPAGRVRLVGKDRVVGRFSRNPNLMRLFQRAGLASQKGTGLAVAARIAASVGCRLEFQHSGERFEASVVIDPALAARASRIGMEAPSRSRRLSADERAEHVLHMLADGPLSARRLAEQLGWPGSTVRAALRGMVKRRLVLRTRRSARAPNQTYALVD